MESTISDLEGRTMNRTLEQRIDDWIANGDGPFDLATEVREFIRAATEDGQIYAPEDVEPLMRARISEETGAAR